MQKTELDPLPPANGADGERERPVGGAKKIHGAEERGRRAFGWSLEMQQ